MFDKVLWDIAATSSDNTVKKFSGVVIDSLPKRGLKSVSFNTSLYIVPALINQPAYLYYEAEGSVRIKLNGRILIATGAYKTADVASPLVSKKDGYASIILRDSVQVFEIDFTPNPVQKVFSFSRLQLLMPEAAEKKMQSGYSDKDSSYALGFYYLAFGIVFLILFLFFSEKSENLHFSLFCIFASLTWLLNTSDNEDINSTSMFAFVYALEFLSITLAKILANRKKRLIHLLIITIVAALNFIPAIRYNYTFFFGSPVPIIWYSSIALLMCYSGFSSAYFLFHGFGQKRWEARVFLFTCLGAMIFGIVVPMSISIATVNSGQMEHYLTFAAYFGYMGLCMYPLSAALVLGRRNGLDQKQMAVQVASIEKLSDENLEKEKEKKQLLEAQNIELEQKVYERTLEVMQQKEIIEVKNKAITDNLIYAQRIQAALLPDTKLIQKSFEQSFIVYLPKEIVSGDFYTIAEKIGQQVIGAGDCTGHGVSGAFMSMIGSSLLNQIIMEKGIVEPAEILNRLNTAIIGTLKQGENEPNDGMDIAVCAFDFDAKKLHFAGARRAVWIIRGTEFIQLKPDKFPIGGLQGLQERVFHNNTVDLQTNDAVYLFTDGFADQFGGDDGKKLSVSQFKEILMNIQELDMKAQGAYLTASFRKWKGHYEQVDDVLVIGIRV
jgi:serine phosphatase RsbU (regulator of sigma subunit)